MPAAGYSHYQDPVTGEIILLPQLYPHSQQMDGFTKEEEELFVNRNIIPANLYDSHLISLKKAEERLNKLKSGEEILISDYPSVDDALNSGTLMQYQLANKARLYGESVFTHIFYRFDKSDQTEVKIFPRLNGMDPNIVWLSYVKESIISISTSLDPSEIHFYAARKILKEKYNIEDPGAVALLASAILENSRKIPARFESFRHPSFQTPVYDPKYLNDHLVAENGAILAIDADFIQHLRNIGKKGKELAAEIETESKNIYNHYKNASYPNTYKKTVWGLWVPTQEERLTEFLKIITQALWEDNVRHKWGRKTNGHPSLVKPIVEKLIPILGPNKTKKFTQTPEQIICYGQKGEPLFMAPAVNVNMISAFQKGVKELGTLTGHKMLRWQVNTGFKRWQDGDKDPRLIEIDGGYSKIAELAGCNSPKEIAKIRDILHAQAYGHFIFPDGSHGNMLSLRIDGRHSNNEPSKIRIVLGDMLLPAYVCQFQGSEKRLIPIGDLPPLQGSPNTHAAQAQLQLYVFSEFSNQSVRLAESGSVVITLDMWKQMAEESGLNPEKVEDVIRHWCQPDLFNCFLEKQDDEYNLASYYEQAKKFLEIQGQGRIVNSVRGKRGIEKRREKSKNG